jgi:glutathione S-transferase
MFHNCMTEAPAERVMSHNDRLTFYHSPNTRSTGVRMLLEELAAPHDMVVLNMRAGEQRQPAYLAINPMGKVPALVHHGEPITEQVAIYLYLADLFPAAELAPGLSDPARGPYLRWLAFYGSCFEPAVVDRAAGRDAGSPSTSPYGDYDTVMRVVNDRLAAGPYLLGERFSAADVLWGLALRWTTGFNLVEATQAVSAYVARIGERPVMQKINALEAELAAEHQTQAGT